MKVLLILVDGMRADALTDLPLAQACIARAAATMQASTVMPSVTLPCHMSLFHSVDPSRHGTTTNVYAPQVRPVRGLCEVLTAAKKSCAMFYDWEPLRDLTRPGSLQYALFTKSQTGYEGADRILTDNAIAYLNENTPDFAFLYLGHPDAAGHNTGWMTESYLDSVTSSWEHIQRVLDKLPEDYAVLITADHGGHDRLHGTDLPEDMIIPLIALGMPFQAGSQLENVSILDIAPTITQLLGVEADEDWEGKSLV